MYTRYAESARVEWVRNFALHIDPAHSREWTDLVSPRGDGIILKSLKIDYKFVRISSPSLSYPLVSP